MPAIRSVSGCERGGVLHERDALALDRLCDQDAGCPVVVAPSARNAPRSAPWSWPSHRRRGSRRWRASPRGSRGRGSPRSPGPTGARCGRRRPGARRPVGAPRPAAPPSSAPPGARRHQSSRRRGRPGRGGVSPRRSPAPSRCPSRASPSSPRSRGRRHPDGRRAPRAGAGAAAVPSGSRPSAFSAAYSPGTSCPFDEKNTSRSGESKPSSATFSSSQRRCATTSSELNVEPRWPEPARLTATSAFARHMSARSPRRSSGSSPADPTRANSPGGISSSRGTA